MFMWSCRIKSLWTDGARIYYSVWPGEPLWFCLYKDFLFYGLYNASDIEASVYVGDSSSFTHLFVPYGSHVPLFHPHISTYVPENIYFLTRYARWDKAELWSNTAKIADLTRQRVIFRAKWMDGPYSGQDIDVLPNSVSESIDMVAVDIGSGKAKTTLAGDGTNVYRDEVALSWPYTSTRYGLSFRLPPVLPSSRATIVANTVSVWGCSSTVNLAAVTKIKLTNTETNDVKEIPISSIPTIPQQIFRASYSKLVTNNYVNTQTTGCQYAAFTDGNAPFPIRQIISGQNITSNYNGNVLLFGDEYIDDGRADILIKSNFPKYDYEEMPKKKVINVSNVVFDGADLYIYLDRNDFSGELSIITPLVSFRTPISGGSLMVTPSQAINGVVTVTIAKSNSPDFIIGQGKSIYVEIEDTLNPSIEGIVIG